MERLYDFFKMKTNSMILVILMRKKTNDLNEQFANWPQTILVK